ncbi:MAG: BlaI/MecI/CopY family transcriptional regulator [Gammaproteobacteria bacterium]|nr:BlaI/MecI/CopY family transcriptional regulator [Gammaproteobacteria bacterium]
MKSRRKLARREQEALEALHRLAPCTAAILQGEIGGTYSGTRAVLSRLVAKGLASHRYDGPRYVYEPVQDSSSAGKYALREVVNTFFKGSNMEALGALLGMSKEVVDEAELKELEAMLASIRGRSDADA